MENLKRLLPVIAVTTGDTLRKIGICRQRRNTITQSDIVGNVCTSSALFQSSGYVLILTIEDQIDG